MNNAVIVLYFIKKVNGLVKDGEANKPRNK
jgi:hypothetical protein